MRRIKVGVSIYPQHCGIEVLRGAWREAEQIGVDSIWTWDHFFPLTGDPQGRHFECWVLLAAMASDTTRPTIGPLVSCVSYRNPDLLADMARTVDHLAKGRLVLGLGAGWFEKDYREYGYEFRTAKERIEYLGQSIERIRSRLERLNPPPLGQIPLLIGGSGERLMLRLVAQHADAWNTFGPVANFQRKADVLDNWCRHFRRDPAEIERTVLIQGLATDAWKRELDQLPYYVEASATHFILGLGYPFEMEPVRAFVEAAAELNRTRNNR